MNEDVLGRRIAAMDDKQAAHLVTQMVRDVFREWRAGSDLNGLAAWADKASAATDAPLALSRRAWPAAQFQGADAGQVARSVLLGAASNPECAQFIAAAIEHYSPDEKADFGLLSIPLALGLTHLLIAGDFDIDLGWFRFKKKGLNGEQQKEAIGKVLAPLASSITKLLS